MNSARFPRAGNYVASFMVVRLDSARAPRDAVCAPAARFVCANRRFSARTRKA